MPIIAIALLVAAALGGGTAYAAESSLPGDPLWNFKTTVNEGVQGVFAQGTEAKADWDLNLINDRLEEAAQLASADKLDPQVQTEIEANFDAHVTHVAQLVAKLQADGKADVASKIATKLQATLAQGAQSVDAVATANEHASLVADLRSMLDASANLSADASNKVQGTVPSGSDDAATSAALNADADASASTSAGQGGAGATVHTGTSVRGSANGGIQTTAEGTTVGI